MSKYNVKPPKYFVGQTVNFIHHNKNMLFGKIVRVETHYSQKSESPDTDGYHVYAINTPTSKSRSVWIGEQWINGVIS